MRCNSPKLLIVAGEVSGDLHGAKLARALFIRRPEARIYGLGGRGMRSTDVNLLADISGGGIVGITEVLSHLRFIINSYRILSSFIRKERPDLVILVDFPDFNLRLAKVAKREGIPVIYYISPQIWAWRGGRIKTIANLVDKMLVILPFEEEIYKRAGVDCEFVGHPLLDEVGEIGSKEDYCKRLGLKKDDPIIGLLPGSRRSELVNLLPPMIEASGLIRKEIKNPQFIIPLAPSLNYQDAKVILEKYEIDITIVEGRADEVIGVSDLIIVASGTVTLQAAVLNTPMVIIYKVSPVSYLLARFLVKVENIGLVNIVAGKMIVPELVQDEAEPRKIAEESLLILRDEARASKMKEDLKAVKRSLGMPGASLRGAEIVLEFLEGRVQ